MLRRTTFVEAWGLMFVISGWFAAFPVPQDIRPNIIIQALCLGLRHSY